jgi:hypothetical protein
MIAMLGMDMGVEVERRKVNEMKQVEDSTS